MTSLKGKVSLVTGSTSGIGLGIARALAGVGSAIVLNGFGKPEEISATRQGVARAWRFHPVPRLRRGGVHHRDVDRRRWRLDRALEGLATRWKSSSSSRSSIRATRG
jgi:NAD(P)-dependent dehydrogenase (short-subunit alcohol dehydrogenase family)